MRAEVAPAMPMGGDRCRPRPRALLVGGPDVDARLMLMRELRAVVDVGAVGARPDLREAFRAEGLDYWSYRLGRGVNPATDLGTVWQLARLFRAVRPAIVHTFDTKPGIWGTLAARAAGVPVVVGTVTGLGSLYASRDAGVRAVRPVYRALQRMACRASDCTVFQHADDLRVFVETGLAAAHRVVVIPGSGVPTRLYDRRQVSDVERRRVRDELGIAGDALMVTMVSRVIRSKGVLDFVAAARRLAGRCRLARCVLVGSPDDGSPDRLTARELAEVRRGLTWRGPRSDVRSVLAASDVFVLPSSLPEGVPRALLEAAAMSLPIVTTRTPGCRDVVEDGVNGYTVAARDAGALAAAILLLLERPELRRRFGAASRRRAVERFDLSVIAAQIACLYRGLLDGRRWRVACGLSDVP